MITDIPKAFCSKSDWMYGDVGTIGKCDAIMCPKGYYSESGRQDDIDEPCLECPGEGYQYVGQTQCQILETEREILMDLYTNTGGSNWVTSDSWGSSDPICSWAGVRCAGDQQDDDGVQSIDLSFNNLVGVVPPKLWSLPQLQTLRLNGNDNLTILFSGMSRETTALEVLDLTNTRVGSLHGLAAGKLKELILVETGLTGTFPKEVFDFQKTLERLHLSWNMLVGTIPTAISQLSTLTDLQITGNDFHGPLPSEIGYLESLEKLRLDETLISGVLPTTELSYLPRLQSFSASRDSKSGRKLEGSLPSFDKVPNLESLFLDGHDLSGSIPNDFLSASTYAREVVLTDNQLTGTVPLELDAHDDINIELADNKITGLPVQFCDNGNWMRGNVANFNNSCDAIMCPPGTFNRYGRSLDDDTVCEPCNGGDQSMAPFYGSTTCEEPIDPRTILTELFNACQGHQWHHNDYWLSAANVCDWYGVGCHNGEIVLLNLDSNNLRGQVPSSLFRLTKLQVLSLSSNHITVDFSNVGDAINLMDIRLDSTGLQTVEGIGQAKALTALSLSFNGIRGRFPLEILQLGNLRYLAMNSNSMTGLLPTSFGELRYLRTLKLDRNVFVGPLPSFSESPALTTLDLGSNEFTGTIPSTLLAGVAGKTPMMKIDLSRNRLEGSIPASLVRFDHMVIDLAENHLTDISPALCLKNNWNDGNVGKYGCSAILCPPKTSNPTGRRQASLPCRKCRANDSDHLGKVVCGDSAASTTAGRSGLLVALGLLTTACTYLVW
jgi:Leucine-rich repeat (LRR) protein